MERRSEMGRKIRTEDIITKTIEEMEPGMRGVIIGYFYNHLSVPELSKALGMSLPEVYALMTKGRDLLRDKIRAINSKDLMICNNRYLCTEIFFSCAEEAAEIGGRL